VVETCRLAGRACLIVGGTSGIGLATARRFLLEGAHVVVTGLTTSAADEALETLHSLGPVWSVAVDVCIPEAVKAAFEKALPLLGGRLDVLFHVAGLSGRRLGDGPLHECEIEAWDGVLAANARGTFLTNRAAVRIMRGQERDNAGLRGTVLNTGSVLAVSPAADFFDTVAYAASKGAVRSLTLAAAARYARDRIRFNLMSPALVDTPMSARAMGDPAIRSYLATKQPLVGGPVTPGDCAEAALYLCEPASRFVTGIELSVDGGWSLSDGQIPQASLLPPEQP
jgi:NAD(P)-dependent dehydrogenase (short-subunit alcohol dehydrogenase family)